MSPFSRRTDPPSRGRRAAIASTPHCFLGSDVAASAFTRRLGTHHGGSGFCSPRARCASWWRRCRGSSTWSARGPMPSFSSSARCSSRQLQRCNGWRRSTPILVRPNRAGRLKVVTFEPRRIDWWSSGVQLVGTVFFNFTTFRAMQTSVESTLVRPIGVAAGRSGLDLLPRLGISRLRRGLRAPVGSAETDSRIPHRHGEPARLHGLRDRCQWRPTSSRRSDDDQYGCDEPFHLAWCVGIPDRCGIASAGRQPSC